MTFDRLPDYRFKVLAYEGDLNNIANWVTQYPYRETGGDLFGFWTHSRAPAIQFVLGPGRAAQHESAAFYQDREYLAQAGADVQRIHGLQHIGEWHSHHQLGLDTPSSGDERTIRRMFQTTGFTSFLLCIANIIRQSDPDSSSTNISYSSAPSYGYTIDSKQSSEEPTYGRIHAGNEREFRVDDHVVNVNAFLFRRDNNHFDRGLWVVHDGKSPITNALAQGPLVLGLPRGRTQWSVAKTTLSKRFDNDETHFEVPTIGWYTMPRWTSFLRLLDTALRRDYSNCKMSLKDDQLVFYLTSNRSRFALLFPSSFPSGQVIVCRVESDRVTEQGALEFDRVDLREGAFDLFYDRLYHLINGTGGPENVNDLEY